MTALFKTLNADKAILSLGRNPGLSLKNENPLKEQFMPLKIWYTP